MPIYGLASGVNKEGKSHYGLAGGVNREIKEIYGLAGGVNRKVYSDELLRIPNLLIDDTIHDIYPNVSCTILELDIQTSVSRQNGQAQCIIYLSQDRTKVIQINSLRYNDLEGGYNETTLNVALGAENSYGIYVGIASITGKLKLELRNGMLIGYFNNNLIVNSENYATYFTLMSYSAFVSTNSSASYTNLVAK